MICEKQNNAIQVKRFLKYFRVRKQNVLLCWLTFRNFKTKKDRPPGVKLLLSTTTPDITIMTGSSANVFYDLYFFVYRFIWNDCEAKWIPILHNYHACLSDIFSCSNVSLHFISSKNWRMWSKHKISTNTVVLSSKL